MRIVSAKYEKHPNSTQAHISSIGEEHMRPIRVGVQMRPQHTTYTAFADAVRRSEELGVDTIWNWDHFFPLYGERDGSHFEGWTLLSAMAVLVKCQLDLPPDDHYFCRFSPFSLTREYGFRRRSFPRCRTSMQLSSDAWIVVVVVRCVDSCRCCHLGSASPSGTVISSIQSAGCPSPAASAAAGGVGAGAACWAALATCAR